MDMNRVYAGLDALFEAGRGAEAEDYLVEQMKAAQQEGDYNALIMLLNEMIGYCRETGQNEKSLGYGAQVITLMQQLGLDKTQAFATTLLNVATACRAAGKLQESYQFYMEVFPLYEKFLSPDDFLYASLYNNLSLLFQEMQEFEKAAECQEKALAIVRKIPGREEETAVTHANLATTLCKLAGQARQEEDAARAAGISPWCGKSEGIAREALSEAEQSISLFHRLGETGVHLAAACTAKADILVFMGRAKDAVSYLQKAADMIEKAVGRTPAYERVLQRLHSLTSGADERLGYDGSQPEREPQMTDAALQTDFVESEQNSPKEEANRSADEMSGMEICRAYYETYGKRMLMSEFPDYLDRIAVGMAGEGSDCLGYDDPLSRDHDFGPGFAMWVSKETYAEIGERLQQAYDKLPQTFLGIQRLETAQAKGRTGVCTYEAFLERVTGLSHPPKSDEEWLYVEEPALLAAVSGEVFWDPEGKFGQMREQILAYYPERVWRRKLAQHLALFSQNGQYNYARMAQRGDLAAANLLLVKAAENAAHIVYLLNHRYAPHDKWLLRGLYECRRLELAEDLITGILHEIGTNEQQDVPVKLAKLERLAEMFLTEMKEQGILPKDAGDTYLGHYAQEIAYAADAAEQHISVADAAEQHIPAGDTAEQHISAADAAKQHISTADTAKQIISGADEIGNNVQREKKRQEADEKKMEKEIAEETKQDGQEAEQIRQDGNEPEETYTKEQLVDAVVHMEWKAFDKVQNEGGRASCQNNFPTFRIMRASQYMTWTDDMLKQYIYDFSQSMEQGWNPITEKYARMMESTAPEEYEKLKDKLKPIPADKKQIIEAIVEIQIGWMEAFATRYPRLAGNARTIHTYDDMAYDTSYETYLRGEISTYSDEMLEMYGRFIAALASEGKNLAQMIMENTVHLYGYQSLADAEKKML